MLQAAHQSSADTGDLGGIQRQALLFCHLDGYRNEVSQIGMTAKLSSTDTDSTAHFRFIPHSDLPKLDPGTEDGCQILYQLTEIHTSVRGKVKHDLIVIKCIFCGNELHFQVMLTDLLNTDFVRPSGLLLIRDEPLLILLCRQTLDGLQPALDHLLIDFPAIQYDPAVLDAATCFYDHLCSQLNLIVPGIKIIDTSVLTKTNADHLFHPISPSTS